MILLFEYIRHDSNKLKDPMTLSLKSCLGFNIESVTAVCPARCKIKFGLYFLINEEIFLKLARSNFDKINLYFFFFK